MRKFKIFLTGFILYEFAVITILQIQSFCIGIFGNTFCRMHNYKYFLLCIMVPVLLGLLFWWLPKKQVEQEPSFKEILFNALPRQYVERFVFAAITVGLKKFAATHPKAKKFFDDVVKTAKENKH